MQCGWRLLLLPEPKGDEALMTASGGNFIRAEINRNKRSPQWGAAPIEVADDRTLRITFHVWKFTVTIVIRSTHKKTDRNEKNSRHSAK